VFFAAFPLGVSGYVRSALSFVEHLSIPWGLKKSGVSSSYALASYGILHAMVVPLLLFPSCILGSFSSLLVPELASSYAKGEFKRCKYIISRVFSLSLLFSILVSGIFMAYAYEIGYFIYGSYEVGELLRLLAPLVPLMYLDGAVDAMLKGLGEQLYTMRVNISDSLISVLLIILLLPRFGIRGYVAVIFITEVFNTSFSIIKLLSISGTSTPVLKWVIKPLVSIILSTLLTRTLFDLGLMTRIFGIVPYGKGFLALELGIAGVIYLVISRVLGAITREDIRWGKRIISRKS
jgi:stage V sporulation protein B